MTGRNTSSRSAACGACNARPGAYCTNPDGSERKTSHHERVEAMELLEPELSYSMREALELLHRNDGRGNVPRPTINGLIRRGLVTIVRGERTACYPLTEAGRAALERVL